MPPNAPRPPTVLVVDDERSLRSFAEILLQDLGYSVLQADSGRAAVQLLLQEPQAVSAVLLDMTMPGFSPEETFRLLKEIRSDLPVLILSGEPEAGVRQRFPPGALAGYVQKPYTDEELEVALAGALTDKPAAQPQPSEPAAAFKLVRLSQDDINTTRHEFLATCYQNLPKMRTLLANGDFLALEVMGHSLKGSGGCFGSSELSHIGRALESFAQSTDAAACGQQFEKLRTCLDGISSQNAGNLETVKPRNLSLTEH